MDSYRVIGLMSGTSMDGLDLADVTFKRKNSKEWSYSVNGTQMFAYNEEMRNSLLAAFSSSAAELAEFSAKLGVYYAEKVNLYLQENDIRPTEIDFIASHGQTIFHQPEKQYTLQIGNGPELAVFTGLPTVVDFRTKDVALGGNGAPLIPVADFLLFNNEANTFLNLGGFSNFSFQKNEKVYSYDICPVNIVVNDLVKKIGKEYDGNGDFGKTGVVNVELLDALNKLEYYQQAYPKSLGWEWVNENVQPLFNQEIELQDKVRTIYEHIAIQIGSALNQVKSTSTLVTGGGAKNSFLIDRIQSHTKSKIILPSEEIIDFKEAIGFAFLGMLRWRKEINVWSSVTGSNRDSCSGVIVLP